MERMNAKLAAAAERIKARMKIKESGSESQTDGSKTSQSDRKRHQKELENSGIFRRFQNVTFAAIERRGIPEDKTIQENYKSVRSYAAFLNDNISKGYGLILAGGYGTMKTTLAVAVLRAHIDAGGYGLFVPMCSLMDNLFTMRDLSREEWARYEKRIRSTHLLVLDDLGSEDTDKSWVRAKADSIITERYNKMLPIIVTTNLTQEELLSTYSGRIVDRLRNTSLYLTFGTGSQRRVIGGNMSKITEAKRA